MTEREKADARLAFLRDPNGWGKLTPDEQHMVGQAIHAAGRGDQITIDPQGVAVAVDAMGFADFYCGIDTPEGREVAQVMRGRLQEKHREP